MTSKLEGDVTLGDNVKVTKSARNIGKGELFCLRAPTGCYIYTVLQIPHLDESM